MTTHVWYCICDPPVPSGKHGFRVGRGVYSICAKCMKVIARKKYRKAVRESMKEKR